MLLLSVAFAVATKTGGLKLTTHKTASREDWLELRKALLEKEKELTRLKDQLATQRRQLPWVKVDQDYSFTTENGPSTLAALFGTHNQLIIYHFMYGENWETGCVSCSFWADSFNGLQPHLNNRDIAFVVVSSAPLEKLVSFKRRMGWDFNWVSASSSNFNRHFDVSFGVDHTADKAITYNYRENTTFPADEAPGISVFAKDENGDVFHTYSTYARGLENTNAAYSYMDLVPKGRDEPTQGHTMSWVRHHDSYK